MSKVWVMAVGINHYQLLQPLQCAQQDAQAIADWFIQTAGVPQDQVLLMTEASPLHLGYSTYPDRPTLEQWLDVLRKQRIEAGDSLWFFFSGYGDLWHQEDYLLPIEANPAYPPDTWFSLKTLFATLKTLPTDRTVVLLDINRSQSVRRASPELSSSIPHLGQHTAQLAREFSIATVLSCQPQQFSYESPMMGQGVFTLAVLESLRSAAGQPLSEWAKLLRVRLPELGQHVMRPLQEPCIIATPEQLERWQVPPIVPSLMRLPMLQPGLSAGEELMTPHSPERSPERSPEPSSGQSVETYITGKAAELTDREWVEHPSQQLSQPLRRSPWGWLLGLIGLILLGWGLVQWGRPALEPRVEERSSENSAKSVPSPSVPRAPMAADPPASTPPPPPTSLTPPSWPIASSGGRILAEAQGSITPINPAAVSRAIARAQQISPQDPAYPLAKQQIDRWCRDLLELAEQQAIQGNFRAAIATAQRIPKAQPTWGQAAQQAIGQWQQRVR